jgi:predicted transcriptional regulator
MARGPYSDRSKLWEAKRAKYLGWRSDRGAVASMLQVSTRTIERYELEVAPPWYEAALIGFGVLLGTYRP